MGALLIVLGVVVGFVGSIANPSPLSIFIAPLILIGLGFLNVFSAMRLRNKGKGSIGASTRSLVYLSLMIILLIIVVICSGRS